MSNYPRYATTGTTSPIYIPRDASQTSPKTVCPGESYFYVKIKDAQAAFTGPIWERVPRLIVTSKVSLNHPRLGKEPMLSIQRSREVRRHQAQKLGLSPNLINLVPAVMTHISIAVEFVLDKENRLFDMAALINHSSFLSAVSLAPNAAVAALTIGALSEKILQTFLKPADRQPILHFSGDFNLAAGELRDGYYVILGTRDPNNPLPYQLKYPHLKFENGDLLYNKKRVTQLSYLILEVRRVDARTRGLNDGAPWEEKLRSAEAIAERLAGDPFDEQEEKKQAWAECKNMLKEAQLLLQADPNYLPREAKDIIKKAFADCQKQIFDEHDPLPTRETPVYPPNEPPHELEPYAEWVAGEPHSQTAPPDFEADRAFLGIAPDEDLEATLSRYAQQVAETRRILEQDEMS
ncbi:MAG: hypothetical protein ACPGWR_15580 [Ardenticatenaceae bacterium]